MARHQLGVWPGSSAICSSSANAMTRFNSASAFSSLAIRAFLRAPSLRRWRGASALPPRENARESGVGAVWLYQHVFAIAHVGHFVHLKIWLVGASGFEPPTPTMSRWCSNQLSYAPAEDRRKRSQEARRRPRKVPSAGGDMQTCGAHRIVVLRQRVIGQIGCSAEPAACRIRHRDAAGCV